MQILKMKIPEKIARKINIFLKVLIIVIAVHLFNKYVVSNWDYLKQLIFNLFQ